MTDDLLDVFAESVQVVAEVGLELGGVVEEGFQGEPGGVVEDVSGLLTQGVGVQNGHSDFISLVLNLLKDRFLGGLKQAIQPPENEHGQDNVPVFTPDKNIP